jgi:hypothetical protein
LKTTELELRVLVRDRPITEYPHDDKVFVEGRPGSEYEIEVHNHSHGRIEAVVSVDGLGVIDGKPAGSSSRGYLLKAGETLRVPGWTLDTANVAKFAFARKPESYATQMTGCDRNNGVIGVMAFREHQYYWPSHGLTSIGQPIYTGIATNSPIMTNSSSMRGMSFSAPGASLYSNTNMNDTSASASVTTDAATANLGTAFGDATAFNTHSVAFTRGLMLGTLVLYYDNRRGLKARGVRIERRPAAEPQAFPAGFCAPPPGWQG